MSAWHKGLGVFMRSVNKKFSQFFFLDSVHEKLLTEKGC